MIRRFLPRRTVLRGLVAGSLASVALPRLDAMLNHSGTAYADGSALGPCFIYWFWGNGKMGPEFDPADRGGGFRASRQLQPFFDAGLERYLSTVSNVEVKRDGRGATAHHTGHVGIRCAALHSSEYWRDGGTTIVERVASEFDGSTRERMVRCGVSENYTWGGNHKRVRHGDMDPRALYDRLFRGLTPTAPRESHLDRVRGLSVVDAVREDARALALRVGREDRERIDTHLDHLRTIERRLEASPMSPAVCAVPARPAARAPYHELREDFEGRNRLFSDIVVAALSCGIARVADIQFSRMQTQAIFWPSGTGKPQHSLSHDNTSESSELMSQQITFTMQQLTYLVKRLADTPLGAGNLLDRTLVFAASEQDSGPQGGHHDIHNMPALFIGGAGGLRGHYHHRANRDPVGRLHMTIARALSIDIGAFGSGENRATEPFSELFT
ncbi:MAG: DUF1552 domain-containing protein [Myxococcota bacterium]